MNKFKKINWKILLETVFFCLYPMVLGALIYDTLPNQIPVHFDINNVPDNYASKGFALFGIPLIMAFFQIICCVATDVVDKNEKKAPKFNKIIIWVIPILCNVIYYMMLTFALGKEIDVRRITCGLLAVLFIFTGNYLPKISFEQSKKYMHPAPKNEKMYRKTTRIFGYLFFIFGILLLNSIFFAPVVSAAVIVCLVVALLIASIYAYASTKN